MMSHLGFSLSCMLVKCVSWKSTTRILFPFPIFHQWNKDTNQSEQRARLLFFSVEALKRSVNLAMEWGVVISFLNFFRWSCFSSASISRSFRLFHVIYLASEFMEGLQCRLQVCCGQRTRLFRSTQDSNVLCFSFNISSMSLGMSVYHREISRFGYPELKKKNDNKKTYWKGIPK